MKVPTREEAMPKVNEFPLNKGKSILYASVGWMNNLAIRQPSEGYVLFSNSQRQEFDELVENSPEMESCCFSSKEDAYDTLWSVDSLFNGRELRLTLWMPAYNDPPLFLRMIQAVYVCRSRGRYDVYRINAGLQLTVRRDIGNDHILHFLRELMHSMESAVPQTYVNTGTTMPHPLTIHEKLELENRMHTGRINFSKRIEAGQEEYFRLVQQAKDSARPPS